MVTFLFILQITSTIGVFIMAATAAAILVKLSSISAKLDAFQPPASQAQMDAIDDAVDDVSAKVDAKLGA